MVQPPSKPKHRSPKHVSHKRKHKDWYIDKLKRGNNGTKLCVHSSNLFNEDKRRPLLPEWKDNGVPAPHHYALGSTLRKARSIKFILKKGKKKTLTDSDKIRSPASYDCCERINNTSKYRQNPYYTLKPKDKEYSFMKDMPKTPGPGEFDPTLGDHIATRGGLMSEKGITHWEQNTNKSWTPGPYETRSSFSALEGTGSKTDFSRAENMRLEWRPGCSDNDYKFRDLQKRTRIPNGSKLPYYFHHKSVFNKAGQSHQLI